MQRLYMNFVKNIFTLSVICISSVLYAQDNHITIEPYQAERDKEAVIKIIKDHPQELDYSSIGYAQDYTEKFLDSANYITEVIRVNNVTVGFVNYKIWEITVLTFNLGRTGLLHLLGIDKDYQHQGLGRLLLQHALAKMKACYPALIMINTKRHNTLAQHLYEKEGFKLVYPNATDTTSQDFIYTMQFEIPAGKMPQGNIIQRYPKTTLAAIGGISTGALLWWLYGSK
jgi:ribosomal protein S18 acetylase RimI-like enzyme